jgi:hypothetical protein
MLLARARVRKSGDDCDGNDGLSLGLEGLKFWVNGYRLACMRLRQAASGGDEDGAADGRTTVGKRGARARAVAGA